MLGLVVPRLVADQQCASLECAAWPDRSYGHEIEIEDAANDRGELLEDVADVEAGGDDTGHLGKHGHPLETIALLLEQHEVLDDRAEHFRDPPSGDDVSFPIYFGRDRLDGEASDRPIDTLERYREAGRQTIPLHVRDRRDPPVVLRNEQQPVVRNHLAEVRREAFDKATCVRLTPHRSRQSHGGGVQLDQVQVNRWHCMNHPTSVPVHGTHQTMRGLISSF